MAKSTTSKRVPLVCIRPPAGQTGLREVEEALDRHDPEDAIFWLERVIENVETALTRRIEALEGER